MIIERTTKESILPEAVDALVTTASVKTYHADYNQRPPLGIYNVALSKVLSQFTEVLDALDELLDKQFFRDQQHYGTSFAVPLITGQENLLKAIVEYFDECRDVLRCFYPYSIGSKNKIFWKEVEVDAYWQTIQNDFHKPVSAVVNSIKHDSIQLRFFVMFNDEHAIPGYFVEGIDEHGMILPNREIHKPVMSAFDLESGYDTAFSFFRDLRYLFWGIYFVSHNLAKAILHVTGQSASNKYSDAGKVDDNIIHIAQRISTLPLRFYSDELKKELPGVKLLVLPNETRLKLEYPDTEHILVAGDGAYKNMSIFLGDGVSTTYKFPYSTGGKL